MAHKMKVALVGIGKIAVDQHVPAIDASPDWDLACTVSRKGHVDEVQAFAGIDEMLAARPDVGVVSLALPPVPRFAYAEAACGRGLKAIIAGAGGAAHLPGMIAAKTTVPVLGVPVASRHLQGVDSLHSIVQMPKGIPVATFAIGTAGAANAALFAVALLANESPELRQRLEAFRAEQTEVARNMTLPPTA